MRLPSLAVEPLKRRKLYQDITERLEGMMLAGELAPGDPLPSERELMDAFQVGRTSVREALFALQTKGLVVLRSGERAYVTRPSAASIVDGLSTSVRHLLTSSENAKDLQQVRRMLEVSLVRHAAREATARDVTMLERALVANRAAVGDTEAFARTDVAFHFVLAKLARNDIITSLHTAMVEWLAEQRLTSLRMPGAEDAALAAHLAIFQAVAGHDPDAAEAAMESHLTSVAAAYWRERSKP